MTASENQPWRRDDGGAPLCAAVKHPSDLTASELDDWCAFQAHDPRLRNPFLTAEFALTVGGVDEAARVAAVSRARQPVGFWAFTSRGWGRALPIGRGTTTCQAFVDAPGARWDWQSVLRAAKVNHCEFDHLIGSQANDEPGLLKTTSSTVDLADGWARYLEHAQKQSAYVKEVRYKRRRIERELGAVTFRVASKDDAVLDQLVRWKSEQYRRSGWRDPFADPTLTLLLHALQGRSGPSLRTMISSTWAGERVIACDFSLVGAGTMACWFTAFDPSLAKHSPGAVHTFSLLEAAAAEGIETLDLAKGDQGFKDRIRNAEIEIASGGVHDGSPYGTVLQARRIPSERTRAFVLTHPKLRAAVRRTLRGIGSARVRQDRHG